MRAIILIFDLWLLISVAAADYFCVFYLYLNLLLPNYFYLFITIHKTLWPNLQEKRLLTYKTSKNDDKESPRHINTNYLVYLFWW